MARAADVSPSTIYRYCGTKEGLILHDEYDDRLLDVLRYCLDQGDDFWSAARTSLATIWEDHFVTDAASTRLRTRLWFEIPRVQAAGYLVIADQVDQFARIMADTGRWSFPQARIISSGIVWSFVAALRNWYDSGLDTDWRDHITELITWLRASTRGPPAPSPNPLRSGDGVDADIRVGLEQRGQAGDDLGGEELAGQVGVGLLESLEAVEDLDVLIADEKLLAPP